MKQEMTSYIQTIKEEIFTLSKCLHKNSEDGFSEETAQNHIIGVLKRHDFNIKNPYVDIPYAFYAEIGYGHPKICYICELDSTKEGYISGNNLLNTISVAAGLALSKIIKKVEGTVILIGCPSQYLNDKNSSIIRNNIFDDLDAAFMANPHIVNAENQSPKDKLQGEKELIPNGILSRLFFHNLKECGVINIIEPKASINGRGLNLVSHLVPCINPYIAVVEDFSIPYGSDEFAVSTLSHFAEDRIIKAADAFAFTGLDLIQNENLLNEVKTEFYANIHLV